MAKRQLPRPPRPKDAEAFDPSASPRHTADTVETGQWYWVSEKVEWKGQWTDDDGKDMKKGATVTWLGCVMEIGSNFVELHSPHYDSGYHSERVHFDDFEEQLKFADDADQHIAGKQLFYKQRINALMEEVREVTQRLGIVPTQQISDHSGEGTNALVVLSAQPDTSAYKKALILAAETTLPELFKQIKKANKELARWLTAPTMSLSASIGPMEETIGAVKDRIYTIELYAGLTEEAVKCCEGKPADVGEKLHVMQRRLYMDEECLANYTAGGMDFQDIGEFDTWISKPENRDRLLPFPRTLAAFRVRRSEKEREDDGNIRRMYINFELAGADKKTFLYVRNGEQVWRVDCDFVFDEMILPNKDDFNPSEPMMVMVRYSGTVEGMMPRKRWESLMEEDRERERKSEEWEAANPEKDSWRENPFRDNYAYRDLKQYKPFDPTNVYFDDAMKHIAGEVKRYNRIAVIVQGLFDRSEVLHPHIPVKMWDPESFGRSVELVYDAVTLTYGEKPDFEAFRAKLNASLDADSIVTGQEDFWLRREAKKENMRIRNDYRFRGTHPNYTRYHPDGDPGPGLVGPMVAWKGKKARFKWSRESRTYSYPTKYIEDAIDVPASVLLNVSAYKPGDFKQFFADPRTRREYLKWAPLLLSAEDHHAGRQTKKRKHRG